MGWERVTSLSAVVAALAVAALPSAAAASPPVIESESVSNVTSTDATLEARINAANVEPLGSPEPLARYQFQLAGPGGTLPPTFKCPTEGFPAHSSLCVTVESEAGALPITWLFGRSGSTLETLGLASAGRALTPGTTYRYRVIAATAVFTFDTIAWAPPIVYGPERTFTTPPVIEKAQYSNWAVSGALTDAKQGQAIALPGGSDFNGSAELAAQTGAGSVSGTLMIPPFTAPLKLFGVLPVTLGLTVSETAPLQGALAPSEATAGDERLAIPAKLDIGITSVGLLGLTIPARCHTAEPVALALTDDLTREALLRTGWSFTGSTGIPRFQCEGAFLGRALGAISSALLSGPGNPYSLAITPPAG